MTSREDRNKKVELYLQGFQVCTKCLQEKPLNEFNRSYSPKYLIPYVTVCKKCRSKINKEKYKLIKEWYDKRKNKN